MSVGIHTPKKKTNTDAHSLFFKGVGTALSVLFSAIFLYIIVTAHVLLVYYNIIMLQGYTKSSHARHAQCVNRGVVTTSATSATVPYGRHKCMPCVWNVFL